MLLMAAAVFMNVGFYSDKRLISAVVSCLNGCLAYWTQTDTSDI